MGLIESWQVKVYQHQQDSFWLSNDGSGHCIPIIVISSARLNILPQHCSDCMQHRNIYVHTATDRNRWCGVGAGSR